MTVQDSENDLARVSVALTVISVPSSSMTPLQCVLAVLLLATSALSTPSPRPKTFFFDGFGKNAFTISRVTTDDNSAQQQQQQYSVKFVPLISLLMGFLPNLMTRFGQFGNVNKVANTRRFDVADKLDEGATTVTPTGGGGGEKEEDEDDEPEEETELIECDGAHLGLWPDTTDTQRYYKCEVDPRTPAHAACVKDLYKQALQQRQGKEMPPLEKLQVPGVRPCFLLSMLKCSNGFKYQHRTRICVPDIVWGGSTTLS